MCAQVGRFGYHQRREQSIGWCLWSGESKVCKKEEVEVACYSGSQQSRKDSRSVHQADRTGERKPFELRPEFESSAAPFIM